jgi:methyl-accepting chemotaxis protein
MLLTFSAADSLVQAEEVIEGILVGAFGNIGYKVKRCIKKGELMFEDIKSAIILFDSAITNSAKEDLSQAFSHIGNAMSKISEEIRNCKEIVYLVNDIERIAEEFLCPEKLIIVIGEKIIWHGSSILDNIKDTVTNFKNEKNRQAGENIGEIIRIIFLNFEDDPIQHPISYFQGFFNESFQDGNLKVENFVSNANSIVDDINKTIHDIENDPLAHFEGFFSDLADMFPDNIKSSQQHQASIEEHQTFSEWANKLKNIQDTVSESFVDIKNSVNNFSDAIPDLINSSSTSEQAWPQIESKLDQLKTLINNKISVITAISESIDMDPDYL